MAEATPNPTPAAESKPEAADYSALLEKDEAAVPTEAVQTEEAAEQTDDAAAPAEADPKAAPEAVEQTPAPAKVQEGTPDKVLQQMQQDLAASTRKIEALQAKVDAGEKLTPTEKGQVAKEQRKLDTVRAALAAKGKDIDLLDPGLSEALAASVLEADQSIEELRKENAATRAELEQIREQTSDSREQTVWNGHKAAYPGVAVEQVWGKAVDDAVEMLGLSAEEAVSTPVIKKALKTAASKLFHQRADAAAKSLAGKSPAGKAKDSKTTTRSTPPVTPGGGRVTQGSGVVNTGKPSEDAQYLQAANALVSDD